MPPFSPSLTTEKTLKKAWLLPWRGLSETFFSLLALAIEEDLLLSGEQPPEFVGGDHDLPELLAQRFEDDPAGNDL